MPAAQLVKPESTLSRGVRQRVGKSVATCNAVRSSLIALNSLGGYDDASGSGGSHFSDLVRRRLSDMHANNPPPPGPVRQEAAELLSACGYPYEMEMASAVVPFARDRVAWPREGFKARSLSRYTSASLRDQFEGADRSWVRQAVQVRLKRKEEGAARLYHDVILKQDRAAYRSFVREGHRRGLFSYGRSCREKLGLFFVKKKDGNMRMIADCRRSSQWFSDPPSAKLFSSGGFVNIDASGCEQLWLGR